MLIPPPQYPSASNGAYRFPHRPKISLTAFTLLELLTVLAIVGILLAILLPVLEHVREAGRASSCLAHERQIAMGVLAYTQDWDERFPQLHPTPDSGPVFATPPPDDSLQLLGSWRGRIAAHISSPALFGCPSDVGFDEAHPSSYAPNGYLDYGAALSDVPSPATTILAAEIAGGSLAEDLSPWLGKTTLLDDIAAERHNGMAQYAFVDGHVRSLSFDQTWAPVNDYTLLP